MTRRENQIASLLAWAAVLIMFAIIGHMLHGVFVPNANPATAPITPITEMQHRRLLSARGFCEMERREIRNAIYDIAGEPIKE